MEFDIGQSSVYSYWICSKVMIEMAFYLLYLKAWFIHSCNYYILHNM